MSRASELQGELALLKQAAAEAARITMRYFQRDPHVMMKPGNSPVTEADLAADSYLCRVLSAARPDYGWLSEETADDMSRLSKRRCFIVDPIDGTKAFIAGRSQWCVSVGLVEDGIPVAGVLDCPVRKEVFEAFTGGGAQLNGARMAAKGNHAGTPRFAGPKMWLGQYQRMHGAEPEHVGHIPSLAYRIACIADRRFEGTFIKPDCHDWDIAAAAVILEEAGGNLVELDGNPARFNRVSPSHGVMIAARNPFTQPMLAVVGSDPMG